jgi:hypothetical protein
MIVMIVLIMEVCYACEKSDASTSSERQLLIASRIWDGLSDVCMEADAGDRLCVAVERSRITFVGSITELPLAHRQDPQYDYGDCTIMPGLIDAHVHLEMDPCFGLHGQPLLAEAELLRRMGERAAAMVTVRERRPSNHQLPCHRATIRLTLAPSLTAARHHDRPRPRWQGCGARTP